MFADVIEVAKAEWRRHDDGWSNGYKEKSPLIPARSLSILAAKKITDPSSGSLTTAMGAEGRACRYTDTYERRQRGR